MKKYFIVVTVVLSLFFSRTSFAQTSDPCTTYPPGSAAWNAAHCSTQSPGGSSGTTNPQQLVCDDLKSKNQQGTQAWNDANCYTYYNAQAGISQDYCNSLVTGSVEWTQANCAQFAPSHAQICSSLTYGSPEWMQYGCDGIVRGAQTTTPVNTAPTLGSVAATTSSNTSNQCSAIQFKSLIDILIWLKCLISAIFIPLIFALAFIFFLWGVLRFMMASDNAKKQESKKYIWYGLIGLFMMVSVWGIVKLAASIFGFNAGVPYLPTKYLDSQSTTGK